MFKKPVKGKKAKTISCKNAQPDKKVAKVVYRKLNIRDVLPVEVLDKTSYAKVRTASVEGAFVKTTHAGIVNADITLNRLFETSEK